MEPRDIQRDGRTIGTARWDNVDGTVVETLILLPGETEGITSAPRSADDDTTIKLFNYSHSSDEENTSLCMLGSPKTQMEKFAIEGEKLGEALERLFDEEGIPPSNKSNVSPLPPLDQKILIWVHSMKSISH